jgi:hypothetical protein
LLGEPLPYKCCHSLAVQPTLLHLQQQLLLQPLLRLLFASFEDKQPVTASLEDEEPSMVAVEAAVEPIALELAALELGLHLQHHLRRNHRFLLQFHHFHHPLLLLLHRHHCLFQRCLQKRRWLDETSQYFEHLVVAD